MNHDTARAALRQCSRWRTSSYSEGANNCVQVNTQLRDWTGVRDSKQRGEGPVLAFTDTPWRGVLEYLSADRS